MTRRGSLVYYLTSWCCGGLFLTLAMYVRETVSPAGMGIGPSGAGVAIITTYFLVLIFCAFLSLLFAFLLRRLMSWLRAEKLWQWALAGPALALPMAWGVRWAARNGRVWFARRVASGRCFSFPRRARHRRASCRTRDAFCGRHFGCAVPHPPRVCTKSGIVDP